MIKVFFAASLLFVLSACNNEGKNPAEIKTMPDSNTIVKEPTPAAIINKDSLLIATGKEILALLKSKQYDSLEKYFSDSVHFSPYGFIGSGEQTLTAKDFTAALSTNKKMNWGSYDGSGDPINLTAKQYIEKFVYNADFLNAEKTGVDKFIASGNSLNNLKEVYKNIRFIEYHFSGFEKKYAGMDWTSLRLVFREQNDRYYLVAVVHDQWTV
ncbi:MAG: hypothetical protein EOP53_09295 [Sphingobacteriales bacterium]|nr:MAG: hypothetical protein EOP53_09295 [Sphingobacteriales bacterium]